MKTKIAAMFDDLSGKLGNIVAAKGRGGSYIRARVIPFNPCSTAQIASRAIMTTNSQAWAGLSDAQRTLWDAAVSDWKTSGIFGNKLTPSGFNLYCSLNNNLGVIGVAAISVPPAKAAVPGIATLSATQVHSGATTIVFTPTPLAAGSKYIVEATRPMSAGISFVKSKYRIIAVLPAGTTSPYTATTVYATKFGGPGLATQKVFFRIRPVDSTTGQPGAPLTCIAIVS